jgi:Fe-S cluster biogenesis protein NfuA
MNDINLLQRINKGLDEIRPFLQRDGGDVSFIKVTTDFEVIVKLEGACESCDVNQMTLQSGIEQSVKKYAPEVKIVKTL